MRARDAGRAMTADDLAIGIIAGNQGIDTIIDPPSEINEQYQVSASILAQLNG